MTFQSNVDMKHCNRHFIIMTFIKVNIRYTKVNVIATFNTNIANLYFFLKC